MTTYTTYKATGSRWVERVPTHWTLLRAKNFLREVDDRTKTGEETLLSMRQHRGLVPHNDVSAKRIDARHLVGYKRARPDELVLNRMQAGNAMFFRAGRFGLVSPDYAVFRLLRDDNPHYLGYLFRSRPMCGLFRSESKGLGTGTSGFLRLYSDRFAALPIALPSRPEQDQIVAYLRAQDAHIARFIKAKRGLIALLDEQKRRVVHQAITRGIDPSVALKPSGDQRLEDVPDHWEVLPLRRVIRVKSGDMIHASEEVGDGYPIFGGNGIRGFTTKFNCEGPMLLLGRVGAKCGCVHRVDGKFWASEHALRVIPTREIDLEYFEHLLRWTDFNRFAIRTAQPLINTTIVREQICALPPVPEQANIRRWIDDEFRPLDDAVAQATAEIKLILEFRDRQIADVVTGQIDVRGWQPGPDDQITEEDLTALGDDDDNDTTEEETDGDDGHD